jgi:hypothetical protein
MLRWMLFFFVILIAIVTFVGFVLGVPIPGLTPYEPSSPFSPGGPG